MSSEVQQQIQQDWDNREFIEIVSEGIKKIAEFLNDFGKPKIFSLSLTTAMSNIVYYFKSQVM